MTNRLPKGSECQCMAEGCGEFFSGETAFTKHWTKEGHVHPREVGLVQRQRKAGPVWGFPGEIPPSALAIRKGGPKPPSEVP